MFWKMFLVRVLVSRAESCCSRALLVSRKTSLQLDHNDSRACDKPWDGDIATQKAGLFIGPFSKRAFAAGGSL